MHKAVKETEPKTAWGFAWQLVTHPVAFVCFVLAIAFLIGWLSLGFKINNGKDVIYKTPVDAGAVISNALNK